MGFTVFDPITNPLSSLLPSFLASNSGISVIDGSLSLHLSGAGAVSTYDAAVGAPLGIGAGLLLTSGITPGTSNTSTWYGADNSGSSGFSNGDADIDAVVNTVFQTQSYDATTLSFSFNLSDPKASSISFDLVFGSDEYPEWVDAFVDCAVVIVDGVNYALFNNDPLHPLSVISPNLAAGYFQDNASGSIPIEYDGVSGRLTIVAPLNSSLTTHTIKIGIADTGDHILDSGLFIANLSAGSTPGSGVVSNPGGGTSGNDICSGSSKDEYFDLKEGNDTVYAGGGADIIVAGAGNDQVFAGSGNDDLKGDGGDDLLDGGSDLDTAVYSGTSNNYAISYDALSGQYSLNAISQGEGIDTLLNIEQLQFSNGLFALSNDGTAAQLTALTPAPPPPANSAGLVMISGLAAVGSTLTATLADSDGLPSAAGAISWQWYSDLGPISGATTSTYVVNAVDSNVNIWVKASYTDAKGISETPASSSVFVKPLSTDGALTATLITIEGPASASVHSAITTLLLRAVELGEAPYSAIQKIRSGLGVPKAVNSLLSTNAFQILQSGVGDQTTALLLAKLEVEVAVLCTVSDDQNGLKLALALLNKASSGGSFDLTKASDVATILGLDPATINLSDKTTWPKSLQEIVDRNNNIHGAGKLLNSSAGSGSSIESEWLDFLSNWDDLKNNVVPLTNLSLAINQGPTGFATADLAALVAGESGTYTLSAAQLTQGFHDPDGDPLTLNWLTTDHGDWFSSSNNNQTWSIDTAAAGYDPNYRGPLEITYELDDGHGHTLIATQLLLVVDHVNHSPTGAVTISGTASQGEILTATNTLADADGLGPITYQWTASGSNAVIGTGSSYTLTQADVGRTITATAFYTDGYARAEQVSSLASSVVANVDDAATGDLSISGIWAEGGSLSAALTNVIDPDGSTTISYRWQQNTGTSNAPSWSDLGPTSANLAIPSDQSLVGKQIRVVATSTDALGGSTPFSSNPQTIANVNDAPTGTVTITGNATEGQSLTASHTLADQDGLGTISYQWKANDIAISGATASSYVLTAADIGKVISVTASYIDGWNTAEAVTSLPSAVVGAAGDTIPPSLTAISLSGSVVCLSFSEKLQATGLPAASAFKVETISGTTVSTRTVSTVAIDSSDASGRRLLLTLGTAPASSVELRVSYTDPAGNQSSGVIQDLAGNDAASVLNQYATTFSSSSSVSNLASSYRDLILTGTAASGTGNANANTITGNAAANTLNGGSGSDTLIGGAGNDTYVVDNAGDTIIELAGEGTDLVQSSVDFSIAAMAEVENLTLTGTGAINASGNALANILTGNSAANMLDGGDGHDTLIGGTGGDTITGGLGSDVFRLKALGESLLASYDRITDFAIGTDSLDAPTAVSAANLRDGAGLAASLSQSGIQAVLTSTSFVKNGAATFTYNDATLGIRTFLALNDGSAGFSASTDSIIEITGYSGSLTNLAVI